MAVNSTKVIWITGASSGIGKALAEEYALKKCCLILSARKRETLEEVAEYCRKLGSEAFVLPFDLHLLKNADEIVARALDFKGHIDILVNNGGISQRSKVMDTSLEVSTRIMDINFFAQIALSRSLLNSFIQNGGGRFVVISSLSGKFGFPMRSTYAASKHALHGYFETLALENYEHNVKVTMVCPGRIKTDISLNAITGDGASFGKMDEGMEKGMPAKVCAKKIIRAVEKDRREVYIGRKEVLMVYFKKFLPSLFFNIARKVDPSK